MVNRVALFSLFAYPSDDSLSRPKKDHGAGLGSKTRERAGGRCCHSQQIKKNTESNGKGKRKEGGERERKGSKEGFWSDATADGLSL